MRSASARSGPADGGGGRRAARAALLVGLAYAAVSVYWGLGGTWLLDTVGGALAEHGRADGTGAAVAVWAAAGLKMAAAVLPMLAAGGILAPAPARPWRRLLRVLAWIEAAILTSYGLVLTTAGLLVQSGVIARSAHADDRGLFWHAYLWDPWFLLWGLLVTTALLRTRQSRSQRAEQVTGSAPG